MGTSKNSLLARIFGETRPESGRRPRRSFVIEGLEDRVTPSSLIGGSPTSDVGTMTNGIVTITVTSTGDPGTSTGTSTTTGGGTSTSGGTILIADRPHNTGTTSGSGGTRA